MDISREDKEKLMDAICEKSKRNLMDFCLLTNPSYERAKHLDFLAQKLEAVERGEIKKLMIFIPPRHGKSETASIRFPAWFLGRNPNKRIIHASYSATLSNTFSRQVRNLICSNIYKLIFNINIATDSRAVDEWDLDKAKGGMISRGVGGSITGWGADLLIIDDPIKGPEDAESETYRENLYAWYQSVARTRLEPGASQIIIMARWHKKDLASKILEEQKDWEIVDLRAIAEKDDPLGRLEGEVLWPERFPVEALLGIKHDSGTRAWNALYRGDPQDPEAQIFKREWIEWYDEIPLGCIRGGGIDTATSQKTTADNMALVDVCKASDKRLYVDDVLCEKLTVSTFAKHVCNQHKIKNYRKIKLESNNAGEAIKQRINEVALELDMERHPPIDAIATTTDKVIRAYNFQSKVENGTIKFKRGNKKVAELVEHLINFDGKGSDIDDDVDALGFAIEAVNSSASLSEQEKKREQNNKEKESSHSHTPLVTAKSMSNW
jgi:predicted phage terminase large subunit-like protein